MLRELNTDTVSRGPFFGPRFFLIDESESLQIQRFPKVRG